MIPTETAPSFETKALETPAPQTPAPETRDAFAGVMEAYAAFGEARDAAEREGADVLHEEKMERISAAIDEDLARMRRAEARTRRPRLEGGPGQKSEHRTAFETYVRRGEAGPIGLLERKALSTGVATDGGYTAPPEVEAEIGRRLSLVSPIRSIASVRMVSSYL